MGRREQWRRVLDVEVNRWSVMSAEQLVLELRDGQTYEIEFESKRYQVEVELLENTAAYVQVAVSVDDGTLPASIFPVTHCFIRHKALSAADASGSSEGKEKASRAGRATSTAALRRLSDFRSPNS